MERALKTSSKLELTRVAWLYGIRILAELGGHTLLLTRYVSVFLECSIRHLALSKSLGVVRFFRRDTRSDVWLTSTGDQKLLVADAEEQNEQISSINL